VALRAEPRLGLTADELGSWLAIAGGLNALYMAVAAAIAWAIGRASHGLLLAALVFLHGALWYRFELFLNEFLYDPRVWGGIGAIGLASVALGWVLDGQLARGRAKLGRLCWGLATLGVLAAAIHSRPVERTGPEGAPNVVLITMDTTRPDRLSLHGADNPTPNIDRLGLEGVRFDQAIASAPLTEASHLAILTGVPPYVSGIVSNGTDLGDRPALLSRVLQSRGWRTAGFVSAFPLHGRYGWTQGFDVYDDDFGALPGLHRLSLVKAWDQVALPAHALRERRGDVPTRRALAWLEDNHAAPFFLWLHLFDPHAPYEAPDHAFDPPTEGEPLALPRYWPPRHKAIRSTDWLASAYDAEIRYTDGLVGELVDGLERMGVLDETVVVLTADHGESLTEHGYLFDHGDFLYDASLRVPLIIRHPATAVAGGVVPCQVGNLDVTPTVLGILGIDDGQVRLGVDRRAELGGGDCTEGPVLSSTVAGRFMGEPPVDFSLRAVGHKLIRHDAPPGEVVPAPECFNVLADPGEVEDLGLGGCPAGLETQLSAALAVGGKVASPELDAETLQALEALGYVD
jgi:arylsulfatase A-like enzyme